MAKCRYLNEHASNRSSIPGSNSNLTNNKQNLRTSASHTTMLRHIASKLCMYREISSMLFLLPPQTSGPTSSFGAGDSENLGGIWPIAVFYL